MSSGVRLILSLGILKAVKTKARREFQSSPRGWFGPLPNGTHEPVRTPILLQSAEGARPSRVSLKRVPCHSCGARGAEIRLALENIFWGQSEEFASWLRASVAANLSAFEQAAILADLEDIESFAASYRNGRAISNRQLALL